MNILFFEYFDVWLVIISCKLAIIDRRNRVKANVVKAVECLHILNERWNNEKCDEVFKSW